MIIKEKALTFLIALAILTGMPAVHAMAQESLEPEAPNWEFAFIPYGWSTGINGNVTIDGTTRRVEASASDLADIRDTGVSFVFTARKDNWGFLLDNVWASYSDNPAPDERLQTDVWLLDGNVSTSLGGSGPLELLAGFRYYNIDSSLRNTTSNTTISERESWVDPLIGAQFLIDLGKKWTAVLKGDVGGFNVGSDSAYNFAAGVGWRVAKPISLWAGYRYLDIDYNNNDFALDIALSGFSLGFGFHF